MREAPVLIGWSSNGERFEVISRWTDAGDATFDGFDYVSVFGLTIRIDGEESPVTVNFTTLDPNTTVTLPAFA